MRALNWLAIAVVCATAGCGSCGKKADKEVGARVAPPKVVEAYVIPQDAPDGLWMKVSEGEKNRPAPNRNKVARSKKLSDAEANKVLARLSELKTEAQDRKAFALRAASLPPPRTGNTIKDDFPPAVKASLPAEAYGKALEIVRFAPEGDVDLAPYLSVTFNQPMVAVTGHADSIVNLPVSLTPQPEGMWRWIGTKTLLFDPEVRFPQATNYQVEVKEGATATTGKSLATGKKFTFTTPAPDIKSSYPKYGNVQRADPLIVIAFNQRIDPALVLAKASVSANGKRFELRAATASEIEGDESVSREVQRLEKAEQGGRYLVARPVGKLPLDSKITVKVDKGTPSAEGPLTTPWDQSFNFRTYGPFQVNRTRCGYECRPGAGWNFRVSNPIDQDAFNHDAIVVTPKLLGLRVDVRGDNSITVSGDSHANTKYTVSLPTTMKDIFGQSLLENESTFSVGEARPRLWGPQGLVVLDPAAKKPTLDVFSVNHPKLRVRIFKVTPSDWGDYEEFNNNYYGDEKPKRPPGKVVFNKQIKIVKGDSQFVETSIDLAPALKNNLGHAVVIIETVRPKGTPVRDWYPTTHTAWVQVTNIGLDLQADTKGMVAFATKLADGTPLEGVSLRLSSDSSTLSSDAKGIARFSGAASDGSPQLLATRGEDTAFMTGGGGRYNRFQPDSSRTYPGWFVYNDRGMYRPGETVHLKGWLRSIGTARDGDVELSTAKTLSYTVVGSRGNEITKGTSTINALGGFDTKFELPTTPNLGRASVRFSAAGASSFTHQFRIEEFRRPEFEVSVEAAPGPHMIGATSALTAKAKYLSGGVLPSSEISWSIRATPGSFTPPNQQEFSFGTWVPWWGHRSNSNSKNRDEKISSKTSASGEHTIDIEFLSVKPPRPMSVVARASITDVNRQSWSASSTLLVHPADLYVGLKRDQYFVERGTPMKVKSLVVDHEGNAVSGTVVVVKAALMQWTYVNGKWATAEQASEECKLVSTAEAQECSFTSEVGGRYQITASIVDARGRPNQSQTTMWVSGGKKPASRNIEHEAVTLIPDKKEYRPGDTAKILVQSPFAPAEGIVSLRRAGLVSTERITLTQAGTTIEVPILDAYTPNVIVQIDLVGAAPRLDDKGQPAPGLPKRPAYATGKLDLSVPPEHRALQVQVTPAVDQLEPGGETTLDLVVTDAKNAPVAGAELSVVVVDEAVLSLSGYKTPEPLPAFYPKRSAGVRDHHNRKYLKLARADANSLALAQPSPSGDGGWGYGIGGTDYGTIGSGSGTGSGYGKGSSRMALRERKVSKKMRSQASGQFAMKNNNADPPLARRDALDSAKTIGLLAVTSGEDGGNAPAIDVRSNFNALATFAPEVRTDKSGRATLSLKLPDNLTRYRVMVAAAAGAKQFGHGESSITARKSMMVRPSPPRFLNFGDKFQLPVVLQNQTNVSMTVKVAVRAENAELTDGSGRQVVVPANDRVEVLFPARSKMPGTARFQVGATTRQWSDASEFSFPVWTPATTEGFATYGEVDSGSLRQTVAMPSGVIKEFGELQVTTSSTQLQALTDAVLYLVSYKFECSEQLSSRVLAVAALRDVLTAFEAEGLPSPKDIEASVRRDLKRLSGRQKYHGGFGFWSRSDEAGPYTSIHVAHAIARAKKKGFTIPGSMDNKSTRYLRNIERYIPSWYTQRSKNTIKAYSLFVRTLLEDKDVAGASKLLREVGVKNLSMEALGWLLYTMSSDDGAVQERAAIHKFLNSKISETAATATFATSVSDGDHVILHSSRRADGIILEALIADQPKSDLIPKVTRGLLAHRKRGHWGNTQDNAFVLLALDRYFETYEKTVPNFVARAWLGDTYAGEHSFVGRTTERQQINIPLSYLAEGPEERDLLLQKDGEGRMYFRIGMNYALEDLKLEAADHGFAVQRRYEAVDDKSDVVKLRDGSWKIKAGAMVRVRLTMVATSRRYQVALVDPLPGGLEPMNPALAVTGAIPADPNQRSSTSRYWWWSRPWFEHQNMRDERVEAFTSILWAGVHEYSYVGRATTPGTYTVPPTKAEEMYTPETFGRSATDKVTIY